MSFSYVGSGPVTAYTGGDVVNVTYPTGLASGDFCLLACAYKRLNGIAVTGDLVQAPKWGSTMAVGVVDGTNLAATNDNGTTMSKVWSYTPTSGADSGTTEDVIATAYAGGGTGVFQIHAFRASAGVQFINYSSFTDNTSTGTAVSSTVPFVSNAAAPDLLIISFAMCSNAVSHTGQILGYPLDSQGNPASGSLGPTTWLPRISTSLGQTVSQQTGYASVTGGAAGNYCRYTATSTVNDRSAVSGTVIRLHEFEPAPPAGYYAKDVFGPTPAMPRSTGKHGTGDQYHRRVTFQP